MTIASKIKRPIGTMIVYGYPKSDLDIDLAIADRLGARCLEILPCWSAYPDPTPLRQRVADLGLQIHSAHGSWGGQAVRADRVDLGNLDESTWSASVDDLKRCVDWVEVARGSFLVVHPGGLSSSEDAVARGEALGRGLNVLADHARGTGVTICVENMPPGVFPGSGMPELRRLVEGLDRGEIGLALDTGHARISADEVSETLAAGAWLRTTHVHDNDGRQDAHWPPGLGTIDWVGWVEALDAIGYRGPIVLECIKHLRDKPWSLNEDLLGRLRWMSGMDE